MNLLMKAVCWMERKSDPGRSDLTLVNLIDCFSKSRLLHLEKGLILKAHLKEDLKVVTLMQKSDLGRKRALAALEVLLELIHTTQLTPSHHPWGSFQLLIYAGVVLASSAQAPTVLHCQFL